MSDAPPGTWALPPEAAQSGPPPGTVALPPERKQIGESRGEIVRGAIGDLVKSGDRPGAVPLTGAPGTKTPLGVVLKPEGALERGVSMAVTAPAMYAIPGGALGRVAGAALMGGGTAAASGQPLGEAGWQAALDGAVAGLTEGAMASGSKVLKEGIPHVVRGGAPAAAFRYATEAPGKAYEAIKARLPAGKWVNAPALGAARLTVKEAVDKLATLTGKAYEQARAELAHEMNRLDVQRVTGPKPLAGQVFKGRTSDARFEPPRSAKLADVAGRAVGSRGAKATADAASTQEVEDGIPAGLLGALAVAGAPGAISERVMPAARMLPH